MRLIDADALYERICDLEAQALAYVRDETDPDNLRGWSAILAERTAFKHDVFDAPTIELEPQWIPCSERPPENNTPVNITWVNRDPEPYYAKIKDVPFTATGVYFDGKWYWYSSTIEDYLAEYGRAEWDEIEEAQADGIDVIAWMPLPEPYKEDTDG